VTKAIDAAGSHHGNIRARLEAMAVTSEKSSRTTCNHPALLPAARRFRSGSARALPYCV